MATGLIVASIVLVVLAVVAVLGYFIDASVPDESDHVSPPQTVARP